MFMIILQQAVVMIKADQKYALESNDPDFGACNRPEIYPGSRGVTITVNIMLFL